MLKLEAITKDAQLTGLDPNGIVRVVSVEPVGTDAVTVYFKRADGKLAEQMLFRTDEVRLSLAEAGRAWAELTDDDLNFASLKGVKNLHTAELADADYAFADGLEGTILDINQPPPDVLPAP